ncbi:methionine gamma-lyase family protein [Dehalobacter sp. DCM]|uniref:methionine gamma-lyase family protein n=1 Tax=Dehalobacter sp. DCM TaxID=2907827 RepID=UPI00308215C2|nr:methionine gamma-lyase family protein [Dehalobacter sp. DCM]
MSQSLLPLKINEALLYAEDVLEQQCKLLNPIIEKNHQRVLTAFQDAKVSAYNLNGTTGYGLGDSGRDKLDAVTAAIMGTESAIIRHQFVSGTHAIASALYGVLRPGDHFISVTGMPYDTLQQVIGIKNSVSGSLKDWGVSFDILPLGQDNQIQCDKLTELVTSKTKLFIIQRSKGYEWRNSVSIAQIAEFTAYAKKHFPEVIIFVDNCYGELVEAKEPGHVGVDLMAGSLIKNLGGTLAPTGGYIAGREDLITKAAGRFTAPGINADVGATLDNLRLMYQGLFFSPMTVGEALKAAIFSSAFLAKLGFDVHPSPVDLRTDIIQAVKLNTKEKMLAFCQGLQQGSPIDSHVLPLPSEMPGYTDEVIMAGGTFIQGATSEFSADGPIREPYAVYMQGAISHIYVKSAIVSAALMLEKNNLL